MIFDVTLRIFPDSQPQELLILDHFENGTESTWKFRHVKILAELGVLLKGLLEGG